MVYNINFNLIFIFSSQDTYIVNIDLRISNLCFELMNIYYNIYNKPKLDKAV